MKQLLVLIAMLSVIACSTESIPQDSSTKDPVEADITSPIVTGLAKVCGFTSAQIEGSVNKSELVFMGVEIGVMISEEKEPTQNNSKKFKASSISESRLFTVVANELDYGKEYFYRAYARVPESGVYFFGKILSFKTKAPNNSLTNPLKAGLSEFDKMAVTCKLNENISEHDSYSLGVTVGITGYPDDAYSIYDENVVFESDKNEYTVFVDKLKPGVQYIIHSCICIDHQWFISNESISNSTLDLAEMVKVDDATNITPVSADIKISRDSSLPQDAIMVVYCQTDKDKALNHIYVDEPWNHIANQLVQSSSDMSEFFYISNLSIATTYYYWASISFGDVSYSYPVKSFKTAEIPTSGVVDLGLSVKWSTCNLGAESPLDIGNYLNYEQAQKALSQAGGQYRVPSRQEVDELTDNNQDGKYKLARLGAFYQKKPGFFVCVADNPTQGIFIPLNNTYDVFYWTTTTRYNTGLYTLCLKWENWYSPFLIDASSSTVCSENSTCLTRAVMDDNSVTSFDSLRSLDYQLSNDNLGDKVEFPCVVVSTFGCPHEEFAGGFIVSDPFTYAPLAMPIRSFSLSGIPSVGEQIRIKGKLSLYKGIWTLSDYSYSVEGSVDSKSLLSNTKAIMMRSDNAFDNLQENKLPVSRLIQFRVGGLNYDSYFDRSEGYYNGQVKITLRGIKLGGYHMVRGFVLEKGESVAIKTINNYGINSFDSLDTITEKNNVSIYGIVRAISSRGYVLDDGSAQIMVYHGSGYECPFSIGDFIYVSANCIQYKHHYELTDVKSETKFTTMPMKDDALYCNWLFVRDIIEQAVYNSSFRLRETELASNCEISINGRLTIISGRIFLIPYGSTDTYIHCYFPSMELDDKLRAVPSDTEVLAVGFAINVTTDSSIGIPYLDMVIEDIY